MISPISMMSRTPASLSSRRAFTLLELLLVLMLIGISIATIIPHLNGTLDRWQLRETARNLQTTLQMASLWACVRQEIVVFAVDEKKGTFCLRPLEDARSSAQGRLPIVHQSCGQGVEIARMEGFNNLGREKVLMFRPDGTSEAAMIVLISGRPDANRQTLWEIAFDGRGAVLCQERFTDEVGE
jgi:prepilin-type N-terminal cleavage/methylation domain-containing protein